MSWLSSAIAGGLGLLGVKMSNDHSAEQARKQMAFQQHMSNTAVQRAVQDMTAAGINPVLAAGSPASTPGGAMGQTHNFADAMYKGASSAMAYKSVKAGVQKTEADAGIAEAHQKMVEGMLQWLEDNPEMKDAFYGGKTVAESGGWLNQLIGKGVTLFKDMVGPENPLHKSYMKRRRGHSAENQRNERIDQELHNREMAKPKNQKQLKRMQKWIDDIILFEDEEGVWHIEPKRDLLHRYR